MRVARQRGHVGGVGGEEAQQGEQGLPQHGPVVRQRGAVLRQAAEQAVHEREAAGVEVRVEAAAQVVRQRVGGEVEDVGGGRAGVWGGGQEGRALAAEADGEEGRGLAEAFAEQDVFEEDAQGGEGEEGVERGAGGAGGVVQDVGG